LDCREVTDDATRFCAFIRQHSGLYVCDGNEYKNGQSFLRVNLACPKDTVIDGLNRLKDSTQAYLEQKNKTE
jgi:cystathionine beta-lyase